MALLALEAVGRSHRPGRESLDVLRDVSLDVSAGEVVAIWGARRSGKTTLLRVIAGVEAPDAGVVRLHGRDLRRMPASERTQRLREVGYAPKEWRVASGKPVVDHVALPLLAENRPLASALAKAHEAMERVGVLDLARMSARQLSTGELARVALARALVRGPRLLLVDEPGVTADLDERDELLRLVRSIAIEQPDLAIVMTSRDVAGVSAAQRVMSLSAGRLRTFEQPAAVVPFPVRAGAPAEPVT